MALGIAAGRWQWGRHEARSEALALQEAAHGAPAVPLQSLLGVGGGADDADAGDAEWREVTVTGVIDPGSVTEIRGRTVDRVASLQYVAWVDAADGTSVAVNLGWQARDGAQAPLVPADEVTVTGIVRDLEPDNGKAGTRIALAQLPAPAGEPLPAYVMARSVCGDAGCMEGLEPVPEPSLSLGPHLSYAFQWWLFAAAAAPVAILLVRRDVRLEREAAGVAPSARDGAPRRQRAKERRPTDEEIEDAL